MAAQWAVVERLPERVGPRLPLDLGAVEAEAEARSLAARVVMGVMGALASVGSNK